MKINELDELTKEWNRFDADNEYLQSFLELIAAYRESVAALGEVVRISDRKHDAWDRAKEALETAKRLGVE